MQELYEFKYAPQTFDEMILSDEVKPKLKKALEELPNMVLYGPPGTGKGTFVDILKRTRGLDVLKVNCSDETGIDVIRDRVKSFAQAGSLGGEMKIVFLNEADYLSTNAQAMLRDLMEAVQARTRFIFCCNYVHKMLDELDSRCQFIELSNPPAKEAVMKAWSVLQAEGVQFDKKVVVDLVKTIWKRRPDIRKLMVVLRENVVDGVLQEKIQMSASEGVYQEILEKMVIGDPEAVRTVLKSHQIDYTGLYKHIYTALMTEEDQVFKNDHEAVLLVGTHDYRDNIVANREINFMAMYFGMMKKGVV